MTTNRWTLGDLIDLAWQLHRDDEQRQRDPQRLNERDRRIASTLELGQLTDSALYRQWLEQLRSEERSWPGHWVETLVNGCRLVLIGVGFLAGFSLAWGWLVSDPTHPINVVHFWSAVIGLPLLLLLIWLAVAAYVLIARRLPQALPLGWAGGTALQWLVRRLLTHLARTDSADEAWDEPGRLESIQSLVDQAINKHRLLWFWVTSRLTHTLGLSFGVGAAAALIAAFYVSDPIFGWRSALLSDVALERVVSVVAGPWSGLAPPPDLAQIHDTRFSMLDPRYDGTMPTDPGLGQTSRPWFTFAVLSVLFYGLVLRGLTLTLAGWRTRVLVNRAPLQEPRLWTLRERMQPSIQTEATELDDPDYATGLAGGGGPTDQALGPGPLLVWHGTGLTATDAAELLGDRLASPEAIHMVGGLDVGQDEHAIKQVTENSDGRVVRVIVPAWSAATEEYLELLKTLRQRIDDHGDEARLVRVWLYNSEDGAPAPPDAEDTRQWHVAVRRLNDPRIDVDAFTEPR